MIYLFVFHCISFNLLTYLPYIYIFNLIAVGSSCNCVFCATVDVCCVSSAYDFVVPRTALPPSSSVLTC